MTRMSEEPYILWMPLIDLMLGVKTARKNRESCYIGSLICVLFQVLHETRQREETIMYLENLKNMRKVSCANSLWTVS